MRDSAKIGFLAGKPELIREGAFDDIGIALITHVGSNIPYKRFGLGGSTNGFLAKSIRFIGKASHAGAAPEKGRNALQAANLAINAINAWRETFEDDACIRVHPIITHGGDAVNIVPSDVKMETYIRGGSLQHIMETNKKIDQALKAGAMAMGCQVIINNTPGFLPQCSSMELVEVIRENAELLLDKDKIVDNGHFNGSADMGDLTQLIPGSIIKVGGVSGFPHTKDFDIVDEEMAYILPAKLLAFTAIDLLGGSSQKAKDIISSYHANMTKAEYIKFVEGLFSEDIYNYYF